MAVRLQGLRVLLAEDDERVARLLVDIVELNGGMVAGPASTEEAGRRILEAAPVDGAILDVRLGISTSLSLADVLMRRRVPVILTTGYATSGIPDPYARLPVFAKPYHLSALVECLSDACRVRKPPPLATDCS
jgi:DNA-binding NtrC family response regulator